MSDDDDDPKNGSWRLRTLRLPRKPRRSGRTGTHPMGERFTIPFVLNPELAEGSKHEWAHGSLTAVFRMKGLR